MSKINNAIKKDIMNCFIKDLISILSNLNILFLKKLIINKIIRIRLNGLGNINDNNTYENFI